MSDDSDLSDSDSRHKGFSKRPAHDFDVEDHLSKRSRPSGGDVGGAGSSCHQCKSRRNYQDLIFCTHVVDKKNKGCRKKYCEHCLKKFYHEDAGEIPDRNKWSCPSCRKLCTCAACRRKDQKDRPMPYAYDNSMPFFPHTLGLAGAQAGAGLAADDNARKSYALLYAVAQAPSMQKLVSDILGRKDLAEAEKVEAIATLLRGALPAEE